MRLSQSPLFQYQPMLLNRCVITTRFEVSPEVFADRPGFDARKGTNILEIEPGSKQRVGKDLKSQKLVFGSYGGIVVFAELQPTGRWFSERHYQQQPAIVISELEKTVEHRRIPGLIDTDTDFWAVYGRPLPFSRPTPTTP